MIQKPEAGKMESSDMPDAGVQTDSGADLGVSRADLTKGFSAVPEASGEELLQDYLLGSGNGGFVGRARGWER